MIKDRLNFKTNSYKSTAKTQNNIEQSKFTFVQIERNIGHFLFFKK
jgi:hypothetical protein